MKCTECKYHSYIIQIHTHFCDVNPKKPTRIDACEVDLDLPCDKYDKRENISMLKNKLFKWTDNNSICNNSTVIHIDCPYNQINKIEYINDSCRCCPNHPNNGGSGVCHCILGTPKITY